MSLCTLIIFLSNNCGLLVLHSIKVGNSKALHDTVGMGTTGAFDRMFLRGV
jgi:hypothetical protein